MSRDTSFYYSFLVLPPRKRTAIVAVWDFCRAVDDAVDETAAGADPCVQLAAWRAELEACYSGAPRTPQGQALQPFIREFNLPRAPFDELIAGVAMDLEHSRYQTFEALSQYCRRVASMVGLICLEIFGYRDERARSYAVNLGLALQLTNIVRDIAADLRHGRVYLPMRARAGVLPARGRGSSGGRCAQPRRRGDHGWHLLRDPQANRESRLRRVQPSNPGAAPPSRGHRAAHLGIDSGTAQGTRLKIQGPMTCDLSLVFEP
jgi:hypothetical protein